MHSPRRLNMAFKHWSLLATIGVAALLCGTSPALAQTRLGTAASFAILAGTPDVTNTGPSVVIGNLGIHPAIAVTGFPPGTVIGAIHAGDGVALQAKNDLVTAYDDLAGQPCGTALGPALVGLTLTPGVYCFTDDALLAVNGTLTLDAQGDPNAEFIFQLNESGALTIQSGSTVRLINGGSFCNVYWKVPSSASIGTSADFVGNIVALTSITLDTGADVFGRVLARNGTVTLDNNRISNGGCVGAVAITPPTLAKEFNPVIIDLGGVSTLTITLSNANANPATGSAFTDTLPAGVTIAAGPIASTCGGVAAATVGGSTLTLTGGTIPAGTTGSPGTCTVSVNVTATTTGSHLNTLPAGALTTSNGANATEANATLIVPAPGAVTIGKAFSPASITAGGTSTLTITLANTTGAPALAAFTDNLPPGVLIAPQPPFPTNTCMGILTANPGESVITLMGGIIPAGDPFGTCTITVDVTAAAAGSYVNTLAGATATLIVAPAVGHPDPFPACNLKIEPRSGKAPLTVTLNGCGSHKDGGQIVSYLFNFGDGTSEITTACSASHTYTSVGNFTANLVVTDNVALVSTCQQGVTTTANRPPVANLKVTPTKVKVGAVVTLDGSGSKDPDGTIVSYAFSFGDGTSLITPGASAFHPYTTIGKFKPCLVVTDDSGAPSKQVCTNVEVIANKPPSANFDARAAQSPARTVNFTDLSKDSDGQIDAWAWTFGDGEVSSAKHPSHTYAVKGTFTVTLTVTDNNGATSQKIRSIGVK